MWVINSRWLRPCPLYTPPVAPTDWMVRWELGIWELSYSRRTSFEELVQILSFRGRRSRNKVSVGEPAEGSLTLLRLGPSQGWAWMDPHPFTPVNRWSLFMVNPQTTVLNSLKQKQLGSAERKFIFSSAPQNATKNNFQQRISWFSQRWRAQRNAKRNVNCRLQRIIKILNANGTSKACLGV